MWTASSNITKQMHKSNEWGEFIDRIGLDAFKEAVLGDLEGAPTEAKAAEPIVNLPGHGNDPEVETPRLEPGQPITPDTIIRDIVDIYPNTVPVLQSIGMGLPRLPILYDGTTMASR